MALLPKKTYSRRNNDLTVLSVSAKEKENVDPFDELLSSPLKQEVEFQPLSFWGKKIRRLESKEKSKGLGFGLFKSSDSEEPNSPCQRKRKPKAKALKARTLQPESRARKLSCRRKNNSTPCSCINRTKSKKCIMLKETVMSTLPMRKNEGWSLGRTLYPNDATEGTLETPCKNCDLYDFKNLNKHFKKANSINHSLYIRSEKSFKKKSSGHQNETNFTEADNLTFKIFEDINVSKEQLVETDSDTLIYNNEEDTTDGTIYFEKNMDRTLIPFQSGDDSFKFVSVRRHFNYPHCITVSDKNFSDSPECNKHLVQIWSESKGSVNPINWKSMDASTSEEFDNESFIYCGNILINTSQHYNESMNESFCKEDSAPDLREKCMLMYETEDATLSHSTTPEFEDDTLIHHENSSINTSLNYDDSVDKTLCNEDSTTFFTEESKEASVLGCLSENTSFDCVNLLLLNDTDLEEIIQELINVDGVVLETSSTSDDTLSSFMDEETVINVRLKTETRDSLPTGSDAKKNVSHSVSNGVSVLTTSMSELSIKNSYGGDSPELKKESEGSQDSIYEDKKSLAVDLRNVTTRRRGIQNKRFQDYYPDRLSHITPQEFQNEDAEMECDQSLWIAGRQSMDWNKSISFVNPVFESTRVLDMGLADRKTQMNGFENNDSILEETLSGFDRTCVLKPGKKWLRSLSVLKQLQNGTIATERLESTRITGRKFESFMQEMLEIQNEPSSFFTSLVNNTVPNKTFNCGNVKNTHLHGVNATKTGSDKDNLFENFNYSLSSNETALQKTSLNHTVKVVQPEEQPSDFRSALGLEENNSSQSACSSISAKDFILMQCGQEDVLPFKDYFNERTLKNCRKIGEGVYGEVFMYSDTVAKIIPIEGADKVNGEHQKTFAEIIPEVVIASKLSNLRKGTTNRTDGFNELKRCWCVKGKYPKYLLQLWNKYDQQGGSENDSPAMFKDDQLYIILELANGGKDLEAFVFTSSAQSLSILIQAAFSLAVAEKTFEFEHRDLHWGNLLISETKNKFTTFYLDDVEYKIPTKGVKVCIIDFTLSRINHEGCCLFNDLSVDPSLFTSEGDYQFDIYRLMHKEVQNDWSLFKPKTNIFWLHYVLDKMLKMVRYRNKKSKVHIKHLKDLKALEGMVRECKDSADFVSSGPLNDVINKL